jgi:hypothetical protein
LQANIDAIEVQIGNRIFVDVPIGSWNMTTHTKAVTWALPSGKSIRTINVVIYKDSGTSPAYPIDYPDPTTGLANGGCYYDGSQFQLHSLHEGAFDNANFDSTTAARGYIVIEYDVATPA